MGPVRPQLMVLYTNDAVEVRYSDSSRLHILPCGTSFTYHTAVDGHPVHGMRMIQQRCQYVTSDYKQMLIDAMDFRNRFSERPYLCEELMEKDQVVSLYAEIREVAWSKDITGDSVELQQDGSICVTSKDEFGSLILSPHRRDFTVCYLSSVSQERKKETTKVRRQPTDVCRQCLKPVKVIHFKSINSQLTEKCESLKSSKACNIESRISFKASEQHGLNGNRDSYTSIDKQSKAIENRSKESRNADIRCVTPRLIDGLDNTSGEGLNLSPITQASCTGSPNAFSNASGSPVTLEYEISDSKAQFRAFSTPTEELEQGDCSDKPAVDNVYQHFRNRKGVRASSKQTKAGINAEGSFLGEETTPTASALTLDSSKQALQGNSSFYAASEFSKCQFKGSHAQDNKGGCPECVFMTNASSGSRVEKLEVSDQSTCTCQGGPVINTDRPSADETTDCSVSSGGSETESRRKYTWVTRHFSCDECPTNWSPVVKMAQQFAENLESSGEKIPETCKVVKPKKCTDTSQLRKINRKLCTMSSLPDCLPLSCPGQHLHKVFGKQVYEDGKNPLEDPSTFSLGRLKVLLVDGVIYRIVHLSAMKVVEIYPGDGSVLVSQGMSGQFFTHILLNDNKLEERTYSIKSPPSGTLGGSWSVKSLINRAHRFLVHVRQGDNLPASVGLCCWKHKDEGLFEPESTTVLEQCEIAGYGKFTALSNGQVRIVFADRTSLDMTFDFSRRLCERGEGHVNDKHCSVLADKKAGTCRLFLPCGQYQMVDVSQPGQFKRYIDVAQEWASWVNSSTAQRKNFYKNRSQPTGNISVERELQKIQCFNYIVDKTVLKKDSMGLQETANKTSGKPVLPGPGILRNTDPDRLKPAEKLSDNYHRTVQIRSPHSSYNISSGTSHYDSPTLSHDVRANPIGQSSQSQHYSAWNVRPAPIGQSAMTSPEGQYSKISLSRNNRAIPSTLEGFNSVREALLRTSSAIKDIDKLLDK